MSPAGSSADQASLLEAIPETHRPTFTRLQELIEELAPEADVSVKWGTMAYDLDGSLFALSANKKHVNLYILTVGLLAEYADDLAPASPRASACCASAPKTKFLSTRCARS